jgi:hypothetical protein
MEKNLFQTLMLFAVLAVLLAACAPATTPAPPTATLHPSDTPAPPTATPRPSDTPLPPTATPAGVSFVETGQQLNRLAGIGVALGDLNGDGNLDAFVVNQDSPGGEGYRVYLGDGRGQFTDSGQRLPSASGWGTPAIGDVNGDGRLEVITGGTVWLNDGQGRFEAHPELLESSETGELSVVKLADLDGDGYLDLFAIHDFAALRVYLNDGRGRFRDSGQRLGDGTIGSGELAQIALGDINDDGFIDAVSAGWRWEGSIPCPNRVWLNDGQGNLTDSGQLLDEGAYHVHDVALGDVDQDGDLDLVMGLTTAGHAGKVYLNDGEGHFSDSGQIIGNLWSESVALGDLNGDGYLDLFFACLDYNPPPKGRPNTVWLNDGHGEFTDSGLRLGNAMSTDVALGDLNGDGCLDAFVVNLSYDGSQDPPFGGSPAEVWLNTASESGQ